MCLINMGLNLGRIMEMKGLFGVLILLCIGDLDLRSGIGVSCCWVGIKFI